MSDEQVDQPYAGDDRRVALRYITHDELASWREDTTQLKASLDGLVASLEGLASKEDVDKAKKVTLRRVYLLALAGALLIAGVVGGAVITTEAFKNQQQSFRDAAADGCEIRNEADAQRLQQSKVAFAGLLGAIQDENLKQALETFAKAAPPPAQPDCNRLRHPTD